MIIDLDFEDQSSQDKEDDFLVCKQKADQGDTDAQYELGRYYRDGNRAIKSYKNAFKYFKLAADQGHPQAQVSTAFCYEYGDGIEQSNRQAFHYYQLAADQGHIGAQSCLGKIYAEGKVVAQSYEKALHYYKSAADQGSVLALRYLAEAYTKGLGVKPSEEKASFYLQLRLNHLKARAATGHINAQTILKKHDDVEKTMKNLLSDHENDSKSNSDLDSNMHFYQKIEEYIALEDALFKRQYTLKMALKALLKALYRYFNFKILWKKLKFR